MGSTMYWEGRNLVEQIKNGTTITYSYDSSNMRTSKTVGGVKHNYYYVEGKLMYEDCPSYKLFYSYDANGFLSGIRRILANGSTENYGVHCNIFGDVISIYYADGFLAATYTYDSWGKLLSVTETFGADVMGDNDIWTQNSIRYRGYVYDEETQLYYLQSRYYDATTGRFINADAAEVLTADFENFAQYNLFTYCFSNPINLSDDTGTWPSWATKLAIGVGAIVIGAAVVAATAATGGAAAAFVGAAVAGLKTAAVSGAIAAGTSATFTAVSSVISGNDAKTTIGKTASAAVDGFSDGFMWGGISYGASRAAGYVTSKTGIFKRDIKYGKNNFMYGTNELTIWRRGSNFRIDASATRGLHYHLRTKTTGIGVHRDKWIKEIVGWVSGLFSAIKQ